MIQSVSKPSSPQSFAHNHLWLRVLPTNRRHIFVPLFCREFIHEPLPFDATKIANISQTAKAMDNFLVFFSDLSKIVSIVQTS
jgi:hypothetical protein